MVSAARVLPQQAEDEWEAGFLHPFSVGIQHWDVLPMQFRALRASFFKRGSLLSLTETCCLQSPQTC